MQNDLLLETQAHKCANLDGTIRPEVTEAVTRGTNRLFVEMGYAVLTEFILPNSRRADIVAIGPKGQLLIAEVKSCREDFICDTKWPEYRDYCDFFFLAVNTSFPKELLPSETGHIIADQYGGAIITPSEEKKLAAARRKSLTLAFARQAASRLAGATTP